MDRLARLTTAQASVIATLEEEAGRGVPGRAFEFAREGNGVRARCLGDPRARWVPIPMAMLAAFADCGAIELGERLFVLR